MNNKQVTYIYPIIGGVEQNSNDRPNKVEAVNNFDDNYSLLKIATDNNRNNQKPVKQIEQLLYQVMNENSTLREKNEQLQEEIICLKEDYSKVDELIEMKTKIKTIEQELHRQVEMNKNLKSDNIILNSLVQSIKAEQEELYREKENLVITNKHFEQTLLMKIEKERKLLEDNQFLDKLVQKFNRSDVGHVHADFPKCGNCEYMENQLNVYIYMYGKLSEQNLCDVPDRCNSDEDAMEERRNSSSARSKFERQDQSSNEEKETNENSPKSQSDYSSSECINTNEYCTTANRSIKTADQHGIDSVRNNEDYVASNRTNHSDSSHDNQQGRSDQAIVSQWSKLKDENRELKNKIQEMNSIWEEKQKKLEHRCRILYARLKVEKSNHRSSHHKPSSWLRSSMNILIPSKLMYNMRKISSIKQKNIYTKNSLERCNHVAKSENDPTDDHHNSETSIIHCDPVKDGDSYEVRRLNLSNDLRTSELKSRKHAIHFFKLEDKISQLSQVQSSYTLLNQRNNSLIQQQFMNEFSYRIDVLLKEVLNNQKIECLHLKEKMITQENEGKRRRRCIEELRVRLHVVLQEQTNLRNDLITKDKLVESLKLNVNPLTTNYYKSTKMLNNFNHLKQAHNHVIQELSTIKESFFNLKSRNEALMNKSATIVKQTKTFNRLCANDRTDHLEKLIIFLADELSKTIKIVYQLCTTIPTATTTGPITKLMNITSTHQENDEYTLLDNKSTHRISEDSLQSAKIKAAEILCLSLDDLEKLTFLEKDVAHAANDEDNDNDWDKTMNRNDLYTVISSNKHFNEGEDTVRRSEVSFLEKLSHWPAYCEKLLKDFPFSKKVKEEFLRRFNDLVEIFTTSLNAKGTMKG
ncbi:unnamed protein product [Heterobilharzia americana]|nr:unnamed protein product [Heterobilharzia americana]